MARSWDWEGATLGSDRDVDKRADAAYGAVAAEAGRKYAVRARMLDNAYALCDTQCSKSPHTWHTYVYSRKEMGVLARLFSLAKRRSCGCDIQLDNSYIMTL